MKTRENERRDSGIIIILILLLGFICIILASGWALRFAPSWKLDTNMGSNLDPNNGFLTSRPASFIEPLDPAILTNPVWIDGFLTPGISFPMRTAQPTGTSTLTPLPLNTNTPIPTFTAVPTNTLVIVVIPPATKTPKPPPPPPLTNTPVTPPPSPTNTAITPSPSADLQITKTDGMAAYTAGGSITYTIVVSNAGPSNATGASVADAIPASISGTTINCVASGIASCGTNASAGNNLSYTGANISAGAGNFLTITVSGTVSPAMTGNLVNTATVTVGSGQTDPTPGNNSATDTDTQFIPPSADLQITKTDNATDYDANISVQYIIVASNPIGPNGVTGATVTDTFSANLTNITWTCTTTGGASCTAAGSGNISDIVNLPVGGSVTYTVNATVIASPTGSLVNTATANSSVTDPNPGNNSATDTDQLIVSNGFIDTNPDGSVTNIPAGTYLILQFPLGTPLIVGSHASYDLVYYPDPAAPTLQMDAVILQVGNGSNWYTILNWGNGSPDTNTDINPADCPSETDNCVITPPPTNPPGVSINLDGVVPNGTYNYIRIFSRSSPPDSGDGVDVDAITILP